MAYKEKLPKGKYILRATPPKSYFIKHKIKFPSINKAQDYAEKMSGEVQTEKGIFEEAEPIAKHLKKKGGGYIIFRKINKSGKDYILKV